MSPGMRGNRVSMTRTATGAPWTVLGLWARRGRTAAGPRADAPGGRAGGRDGESAVSFKDETLQRKWYQGIPAFRNGAVRAAPGRLTVPHATGVSSGLPWKWAWRLATVSSAMTCLASRV